MTSGFKGRFYPQQTRTNFKNLNFLSSQGKSLSKTAFNKTNENTKDNQKILSVLQKENRTKNQAGLNRSKKRSFEKRLKTKSKIKRKKQGNWKPREMEQACRKQIQKKSKNNKKNKHNVYLCNLREIKIPEKRKTCREDNAGIK